MAISWGFRPVLLADVERSANTELLRRGLPYPHLKATFTSGERRPNVAEASVSGVVEDACELLRLILLSSSRGEGALRAPGPGGKNPTWGGAIGALRPMPSTQGGGALSSPVPGGKIPTKEGAIGVLQPMPSTLGGVV